MYILPSVYLYIATYVQMNTYIYASSVLFEADATSFASRTITYHNDELNKADNKFN